MIEFPSYLEAIGLSSYLPKKTIRATEFADGFSRNVNVFSSVTYTVEMRYVLKNRDDRLLFDDWYINICKRGVMRFKWFNPLSAKYHVATITDLKPITPLDANSFYGLDGSYEVSMSIEYQV